MATGTKAAVNNWHSSDFFCITGFGEIAPPLNISMPSLVFPHGQCIATTDASTIQHRDNRRLAGIQSSHGVAESLQRSLDLQEHTGRYDEIKSDEAAGTHMPPARSSSVLPLVFLLFEGVNPMSTVARKIRKHRWASMSCPVPRSFEGILVCGH